MAGHHFGKLTYGETSFYSFPLQAEMAAINCDIFSLHHTGRSKTCLWLNLLPRLVDIYREHAGVLDVDMPGNADKPGLVSQVSSPSVI